jgi:hypothetical protein
LEVDTGFTYPQMEKFGCEFVGIEDSAGGWEGEGYICMGWMECERSAGRLWLKAANVHGPAR